MTIQYHVQHRCYYISIYDPKTKRMQYVGTAHERTRAEEIERCALRHLEALKDGLSAALEARSEMRIGRKYKPSVPPAQKRSGAYQMESRFEVIAFRWGNDDPHWRFQVQEGEDVHKVSGRFASREAAETAGGAWVRQKIAELMAAGNVDLI